MEQSRRRAARVRGKIDYAKLHGAELQSDGKFLRFSGIGGATGCCHLKGSHILHALLMRPKLNCMHLIVRYMVVEY